MANETSTRKHMEEIRSRIDIKEFSIDNVSNYLECSCLILDFVCQVL